MIGSVMMREAENILKKIEGGIVPKIIDIINNKKNQHF
jgi:hypothetical protein